MPSQYARNRRALQLEILRRVEAGERLRAIGAAAGAPCAQTVRAWAAADAVFGEELARARRIGDWRRRYGFDEGRAEAFLARARAGERVHELLREPGAPGRRLYDRWRAGQAGFAEAAFALRVRSNAALGEHGRARRRPFDQALADRIIVGLNSGARLEEVLAADPALPCKPTLARWRREAPEFDRVLKTMFAAWRRRRAPAGAVPEARVEDVVRHIVEGGSFASYSRRPGGPTRATLRRWFRRDPAFAREVAQACRDREGWYQDQVLIAVEDGAPGAARRVGRLKRHLVRLRHRPGAVHRRPPPRAPC